MIRVVIESPLAGDIDGNIAYARRCLVDSLQRGEAPYASHLLYTQVLDDAVLPERILGMNAGFAWGQQADLIAVYTDRGISGGMQAGITLARALGKPVEYRTLNNA